jgi:hypothetical protein
MTYIHSTTNEVSTKKAIVDSIKSYTSLGPNTLAELGWVPVLQAPKPAPSSNIKTVRNTAPVKDSLGNWVQGYTEVDMFSDTVEATKAEHEATYIAKLAAEATQAAIDAAIQEFEVGVAVLRDGYSQSEIDTFSTQEEEAKAYTVDNTASTPFLDALVSTAGRTKADLVTSITVKAAALKVAVGTALGRKQKKQRDA